jgi:hypothetical protein
MVMLLTIYVIEQGLFNGAIGRIVKSVYIKKQGAQLAYVVVDFEKIHDTSGAGMGPNEPYSRPCSDNI